LKFFFIRLFSKIESKIGQKKQQADTNPKQSKPLKLGQKKDPPF